MSVSCHSFVQLFQHLSSLILHLCLSDSTGSVAHSPGATRRGGADYTGQWSKCCVRAWEWDKEERNNQPLLYLSHSLCYIKFLCHSGEFVSKQNITVKSCLRKKRFAGKKMSLVFFSVGMSACRDGSLGFQLGRLLRSEWLALFDWQFEVILNVIVSKYLL